MKLTATTTSTSLYDLIWEEAMSFATKVHNPNMPFEFEIQVWSWDSIFLETLEDSADTSDSLEIDWDFRFKTTSPKDVYIVASWSTNFNIILVW